MMNVTCHISLGLLQGDTLILVLCAKLLFGIYLKVETSETHRYLTESLTFSVMELQSLGA